MEFVSLFSVIIHVLVSVSYAQNFNVMNFGAKGDGKTDDSQAFSKAWAATCGASSSLKELVIPPGKAFLLKPMKFSGPCKSRILISIEGYLMAPFKGPEWGEEKKKWLVFQGIHDLIIKGSNKIDGRGSDWWKSCNNTDNCMRPTALSFEDSSKLHVSGLTHINSAKNHISIHNCVDVHLEDLHIYAPHDSPNTDGIDISESRNIEIVDTFIGTGDDCVALNSGCYNITITHMTCGPGHGISIGSLGKNGEDAKVEGIHVKSSTLNASDNGLRIKTWQGGKGYARNISFEDVTFIKVANPIVIDQYYCPHKRCNEQSSAVQISDVSYIGARGTTRTSEAIILNCSKTVGCNNITLDGINISAVDNKAVSATCINAQGSWLNSKPPINCLK